VTAAHITPGPFSISTMPGLPFTVPPNSQVPIGMRYSPTSLGDDVASLQIWISTRAAPFQVGLTGGAVPANTVLGHGEWSRDHQLPLRPHQQPGGVPAGRRSGSRIPHQRHLRTGLQLAQTMPCFPARAPARLPAPGLFWHIAARAGV